MAFDWGKLWDFGTKVAVPLATAYVGSKATKKKGKAEQEAAALIAQANDRAAELAQDRFETTRADYAPWRKAGTNALGWLEKIATPGKLKPNQVSNYLTNLPGYQFALDEGMKAWENQYSSRSRGAGGTNNGRVMKALTDWTSGNLARPAFQDWTNQLQTLAGYGREGNSILANAGSRTADMVGGYGIGAAGATGAGINSAADASAGSTALWTNAAGNIADSYKPDPLRDAYANYLRSLS